MSSHPSASSGGNGGISSGGGSSAATTPIAAPALQGPSKTPLLTFAPGLHLLSVPALLSLLSPSSGSGSAGDDPFLSTLAPRSILLISPERPPARLARWAAERRVHLVHFGLGPCPPLDGAGGASSELGAHEDRDGGDRERVCKEGIEWCVDRTRAPLIVCDTSGANEAALVIGCLRRLQRRNFASICAEYRTIAGKRARAANERFIEMFDTDLVSLPPRERLADWFALHLDDDERELNALADAPPVAG